MTVISYTFLDLSNYFVLTLYFKDENKFVQLTKLNIKRRKT